MLTYRTTNKYNSPKFVEYQQQYSFSLGMDIGFNCHETTPSDTASSIHTANPKPWMLVEWQVPSQQAQKLILQLQTQDSCELE